ncbi:hypothetical protein SmJEL517_g05366 [Synchytrium microbalum]|uniref:Aminotransferase class I/classII large domain-containing protein n=1 Tax=Synchytrium microbalum TaxID=1806994 RepID=A0A507BWG8_9FUNG|nr:uncharacterized protein SmJEL517_g05366 [Synchytrium microbalum]TPX31239.1 hypothetical protein SmJEL517_g05366 [Synchytrium microbalum]
MSSISSQTKTNKPQKLARDFSSFLADNVRARERTGLKMYYKYLTTPGIVSLGGGFPPVNVFPFKSTSWTVQNAATSGNASTFQIPAQNSRGALGLEKALQYGNSDGHPELLAVLQAHVAKFLRPQYDDYRVIVTSGSINGNMMAFSILGNKGDYFLVEEYTFSASLEQIRVCGVTPLPVKCDAEGMVPEDIIKVTREARAQGKIVKAVYTIPTAQNPLGTSMGIERRKAFLQACKTLDIMIIEDDPYQALELPAFTPTDATTPDSLLESTYTHPGLYGLRPPILSFDDEGRIIYLYTFSKIFAPGIRLGFAVANKQFAEKMVMVGEQHSSPNGISQAIVTKLLTEWGSEGLHVHMQGLQRFYTHKRNVVVKAALAAFAPRRAGDGACAEFVIPSGGMFVWLKVNLPPNAPPGTLWKLFELASFAPDEKLIKGMTIFGDACREFGCGTSTLMFPKL